MTLGIHVGLGPGQVMLDGNPAPPTKGHNPLLPPTNLGPVHIMLDGDPAHPS